MDSLKYNYVIAGNDGYYLAGYRDIIGAPGIAYHQSYSNGFNNWLSKQLLRWTFSRKLNKIVHTPFAWYVYPRLYPHSFDDNKPICFLFFGNQQFVYQTSYVDYIKKKYPSSKIVLYMQDIVIRNQELDLSKVASKFDLLISYDKGDSSKYGMEFYPTPMSYVLPEIDSNIQDSDVYFCGFAKTRYQQIHEIYLRCKALGYRCDFNIMNLPDGVDKIDGINYFNAPFDYTENLKHVFKTKCIIEIMQEGADGFTPRLWESIMYDKHLITNNLSLIESEYYYNEGIHIVDSDNDVVMYDIKGAVTYPNHLKESLSPMHLIEFIDAKL